MSPISDASLTSLPSNTEKPWSCKKKFVKFKDLNHRRSLLQKYRMMSKKKTTSKRSFQSLVMDSMPSIAVQATRKVVCGSGFGSLNKENSNNEKEPNMSREKITISLENVSVPVKEVVPKATTTDLDDDCICIDPPPEVIVVDDESVGSRSSVYCGATVLRPYEPIGTMRHRNQERTISNNILTSTPKSMFFGGASKEFERRNFLTSSLSPVLFTRRTTQQKANNDVVIIDDTAEPTKNTNQSEDNTLRNANNPNNDVIWIDESFPSTSSISSQSLNEQNTNSPSQDRTLTATNSSKNKSPFVDDSVIFVSENIARDSQPSTAPAFIPLITPEEESQFRNIPETPPPPTAKRARHDLFNSREQRQLRVYNDNAYNPNQNDPTLQTKKRMVIIDGSNVAYHHALKKAFSVKGLQICLDYFEKIGHEVKAIVPQFRLQRLKSTDPATLEKLHEQGKIVFTPCKNLPGKSSTSYDDRFILQLAAELDAAVVSNDNYRDLIHENAAFKKIIENRVIGYTWCNDLFILPKDPYGKWGPSLSDILNRS